MSTADIPAIRESDKPGQDPSPSPIGPLPPDCSPDRFLNWRLRYANHLAEHTTARPIQHEDPWVQVAANTFACQFDGPVEPEPTPVNFAIAEALQLYQSDTLERHVLEARLLVQEEPEEIAQRSRLSLLTITAYAHLVFDVRGVDRKGKWFMQQLRIAGPIQNADIATMGHALKQIACFNTSEDLEDHIDVLCRLDGKTMAEGLPDRVAPEYARELGARQALATPLLPTTGPVNRLLQQFEDAAQRDLLAGQTSSESVDLAIEILRKAKIPAACGRRSSECVNAARRQSHRQQLQNLPAPKWGRTHKSPAT